MFPLQTYQVGKRYTFHAFTEYFNELNETATADDVVSVLYDFRANLIRQGIDVPPLSTLFKKCIAGASYYGISTNEESFLMVMLETILEKESYSEHATKIARKSRHRKSKGSNFKVNDKFSIGFCKALGGGLLCIIPHPAAWSAGASLFISGVKDMVDSTDNPGGTSMEDMHQWYLERKRMGTD